MDGLGRAVAYRVRQIDSGGTGGDGDFHRAAEIVELGAGGIHRGPFDVPGKIAGEGDGVFDDGERLVLRDFELVGEVDFGRRHEGVDAVALGRFERFRGAADVGFLGAGEGADDGVFALFGDGLDRVEIAVGRHGETGLNHVDAHRVKHFGDEEFLGACHAHAGRLLAVAQGGVEDGDAVGRHGGLLKYSVAYAIVFTCLPALSCRRTTASFWAGQALEQKDLGVRRGGHAGEITSTRSSRSPACRAVRSGR